MHKMRAKSLSLSSPSATAGALALGVRPIPSLGFAGESCAINAFARIITHIITAQVAPATANTNAVSTGPLLPKATALGCGASNPRSAPPHPV